MSQRTQVSGMLPPIHRWFVMDAALEWVVDMMIFKSANSHSEAQVSMTPSPYFLSDLAANILARQAQFLRFFQKQRKRWGTLHRWLIFSISGECFLGHADWTFQVNSSMPLASSKICSMPILEKVSEWANVSTTPDTNFKQFASTVIHQVKQRGEQKT